LRIVFFHIAVGQLQCGRNPVVRDEPWDLL
jgi:hypothetical protein